MGEYSEECLRTFLKDQGQLFDEPVAETLEEAEAFLEDCMAVVVDSLEEVREYFEESGADVDHMTDGSGCYHMEYDRETSRPSGQKKLRSVRLFLFIRII